MIRTLRLLGVAVLTAGALAGCKTTTHVPPNAKQPDPLCCSKKPIEGKPRDANSDANVRLDPPPPPIPGPDGGGIIVHQGAPLGPPQAPGE